MIVDKIALILVIVGALNWGGVGLFGFDTVAFLFGGQMAILSRIIYALGGAGRSVVHHAALPGHRGQPRSGTPYGLNFPAKKERPQALFFYALFPFATA